MTTVKSRDIGYELMLAEGTYWCGDCQDALPLDRFHLRGTGPKAGRPMTSFCKEHNNIRSGSRTKRARYGVDYDVMFAAQGGLCAICKGPPSSGTSLCIDHDHACCDTAKRTCGNCVRALLCHRCNVAIAMFRDDTDRMKEAISYVESWRLLQGGV